MRPYMSGPASDAGRLSALKAGRPRLSMTNAREVLRLWIALHVIPTSIATFNKGKK
jgi:hypothetical protein